MPQLGKPGDVQHAFDRHLAIYGSLMRKKNINAKKLRPGVSARGTSGFSFLEMLMVVAIMSIIVGVLGNLALKVVRGITDMDQRSRADVNIRMAMDKIETSLLNANYFDLARSTEVIFRADLITDPNYQPYGDFDGDGVLNINDPDYDNDATSITSPANQWRVGYNLKDDDDDNDGKIDMRWRIRLSSSVKTLYMDYSKNEEAWGKHEQTLLTNVSTSTAFTFFGSENLLLCGTCGTTDSDNDGIVSAAEIDAVANGGNGNGVIDGSTETAKIVTIGVYVAVDTDKDNITENSMSIEVMPPPLYLKRSP